ncbi:MAG: 2-C-methyl-D-erythritol 4-phosphate cytidylyltransferase [Clostridiales bacterium]|nr:2-C-methyl-D-erythritol 4-phosphate cytidylyltransferase [Clostridiales bacterium]
MEKKKITAIVLAAGKGNRMNTPVAKQFLILRDKPVLYYSLKAFEDSSVDEIILVTGSDQKEYCINNIIQPYQLNKVTQIVEGGKERYDSVYQALLHIEETDYVLIHDGARPFITKEFIEEMISQVIDHNACIFGTPVKETVKTVDSNRYITSTPNRNTMWLAQTPQAFSFEAIKKAYTIFYKENNKNQVAITDDAMVYETYLGKPVKMIPGDYRNIKITTPEDLTIAEAFLNKELSE